MAFLDRCFSLWFLFAFSDMYILVSFSFCAFYLLRCCAKISVNVLYGIFFREMPSGIFFLEMLSGTCVGERAFGNLLSGPKGKTERNKPRKKK